MGEEIIVEEGFRLYKLKFIITPIAALYLFYAASYYVAYGLGDDVSLFENKFTDFSCYASDSEFLIGKSVTNPLVQSLLLKHNHTLSKLGSMPTKSYGDGKIVLFDDGRGKIVAVGCL